MLDLLSLERGKSESRGRGKITPPILFNGAELTVSQTSFMGPLVKEYGRKGWYISLLWGIIFLLTPTYFS